MTIRTILELSGVVITVLAATLLQLWLTRRYREAHKALAQNQERLNLTLRSSKIGLWEWDIAENAITGDENCSMVFGLPLGQFPRTFDGFSGLVHTDDRSRIEQDVRASIEYGDDFNTEYRVAWHDGTVRHLVARAKVHQGADGKVNRFTGVCWDVTEPRNAEEGLREVNARLRQSLVELERHKLQTVALSEMADLLQSCSQSTEAYIIVAQFCGHLFPSSAGALYIFNSSRDVLNSVASWNAPDIDESTFAPGDCWALRRGTPHVVVTGALATPCEHMKNVQRDGQACLPLMAQGTSLGILYLQDLQQGAAAARHFLDSEDFQLACTFAERVALCLSNISLQEALRLQSIRDPLTGLFNRRYLEESFEGALHRMERRQQSASLMMIDLDHFKTFNDTFGHEAGDALLRAFGTFLLDRLRKEDTACRYGGEEFCILLCESNLESSLKLAEQLCRDIKNLSVWHGERSLGVITMSVGVASSPIHGVTISELIAAADRALYEAKAAGRDRVTAAQIPSRLRQPATSLQ
jgi:diguanylate cyclase (GGDEF)-like protein